MGGAKSPLLPMMIYLQHPVHGNKVATMELEAQFDEQHGWSRYNLDDAPVQTEIVNELVVKRGRPRKIEREE
jgi:hypothetical protein